MATEAMRRSTLISISRRVTMREPGSWGSGLTERLTSLHRLQIERERIPQAAVALIIRELERAPEILIIRRAERDGDPWSGHLALPGGRADEDDDDLLITAARETREEVGIDLLGNPNSRRRFIGQLSLVAPQNRLLPPIEITPLVAIAPENVAINLSDEVAAAFWMPVEQLRLSGMSDTFRLQHGSLTRKWPAYPSPEGPIWGITGKILSEFLSLFD
jgi:8-oxo-dGTP pyrophosphatase MutT (NUDIX family)